jgi:hypothetical protein
MPRKIAPAAIISLKEALTKVYWYKRDLRTFLHTALGQSALLSGLNWDDYKRNIVNVLIDHMVRHEDRFQTELVTLMSEVSAVSDFSHLEKLEDGVAKAAEARLAVQALQKQTQGHDTLSEERSKLEERRQKAKERAARGGAIRDGLEKLNKDFLTFLSEANHQRRGFRLEKMLRELFDLFDLDPRASFRIVGEQIDGAFTFETTDYLFEGKWEADPIAAADLDVLAGKLSRKLDNTLGLFLSINGFTEDGVTTHSAGRRVMILMDGADLMAVLEGRIDLVQLLHRKRREASQTGNIYLRIAEILR